ncbi:hypothetical protein BH09PLA1_BH09PLA1_20550 [soil metagenome]
MKTLLPLLIVAVLACSAQAAVKHDGFDTILKRYVSGGAVRYADIRDHAKFDLYAYLDYLANTDVSLLSRDEQLAYYINLYNATVIKGMIERWHDGYSPAEKDFQLFKDPLVNLAGGRSMSLNDLENKLIRPTFKDPRVHVALVCGAKSCPPLLSRAYQAEDLNDTLDANMKRFVNDSSRNSIDRDKKTASLSKIFDWYADDFGGKARVAGYISKYLDGPGIEGFAVEFKEYDWSANS